MILGIYSLIKGYWVLWVITPECIKGRISKASKANLQADSQSSRLVKKMMVLPSRCPIWNLGRRV